MLLGRPVLATVVGLLLAFSLAATPASAATATSLTISATSGYAGSLSRVSVLLTDGGAPVAGVVVVERRVDGAWSVVATVTTDAEGAATAAAVLARDAGDNVFRARFDGDGTHAAVDTAPVQARLVRRSSVVEVGGPTRVVDGRSVVLRFRWRTGSGEPVQGRLTVVRRLGNGKWRRAGTVRTDGAGTASLRVRPRVDSVWAAGAGRLDWVEGDRSPLHRLDNVPPGEPVRLPAAAPRPRVAVPPQPRAVGTGAHPVVSRIPNGVWREMTGRTWHRGCPVGRAGLRLVRVNYWGYDGYRYRGELVAATGAAPRMAAALAEMYAKGFPIRSMYRVDRFGWSRRLHGGNDYRSMAAGNTSAFNCRQVVNRPGVRSPHSYGRSLDVNTWENPYRSATGLVPNAWWQPRSHPLVAWRSGAHPVVRIMARHGLRWTYRLGDTQHFDGAGAHGRLPVQRSCGDVACD